MENHEALDGMSLMARPFGGTGPATQCCRLSSDLPTHNITNNLRNKSGITSSSSHEVGHTLVVEIRAGFPLLPSTPSSGNFIQPP